RARAAARAGGARAALAVRFADLEPPAHRAAVRLHLPPRDLRAAAQARARLLRAALSLRRPPRRARRSQSRSPSAHAAGARHAPRAAREPRGETRATRRFGRARQVARPRARCSSAEGLNAKTPRRQLRNY